MNDNNENNNKTNRITDILTIIIFLCMIFIPAVLFWVTTDIKISEDENRPLQQMPELSIGDIVSGKFTRLMGKYYADQFPFRNTFVGAKTLVSYSFGINENKGVVIAKDGYLIQRFDKYSEKSIVEKSDGELGGDLTFDENMANIKNNIGYINKFYENVKELYPEINFTVAIPPRKIDAMTNKLPEFFPIDRHERYFTELEKYINFDIYVNLLDALKSHNDEYIYYRTDHHWTTLGAYYAYITLGEKMGYKPEYYFAVETACDDFYGVTWSKAGAKWIKPDVIEYYRYYKDDNLFITEIHGIDNSKKIYGFYNREKLETKDKYSSFLGGINSRISIYVDTKKSIPNSYKLLLISDSFGQSLAPFLAWHYHDIEIIDTRFFTGNIYDFIDEYDIGNILVLINMENLSTQNNLVKLTRK